MKFYQGTGKKLSASDFSALAKKYNVPESRLRAVAEVEARGTGYNSQNYLIALYEPHIAFKYAKGETRAKLEKAGLAYKTWVRNYPKTSYDRIDRATTIAGEELAALSTSWGMGQVMGFNHAALGFNNALDLVKWLAVSEANQLEGIIKFSASKGILDDLVAGRWANFALGYNGKGYKENNYDTKLQNADRKWQAKLKNEKIVPVTKEPTVDIGTKGKQVEAVQEALKNKGYDIEVDGDFGGHTEEVLKQFQEDNGLKPDGQAGALTKQKLAESLKADGKDPSAVLGKPPEIKPSLLSRFGYWLASLPFAGGMAWASDWRIVLGLFLGLIVVIGLGILAQDKIISAYKKYRDALEE